MSPYRGLRRRLRLRAPSRGTSEFDTVRLRGWLSQSLVLQLPGAEVEVL